MGATRDVRSVWRAFAADFRWVAGVAGTHDLFGKPPEREQFLREPDRHAVVQEISRFHGRAWCGPSSASLCSRSPVCPAANESVGDSSTTGITSVVVPSTGSPAETSIGADASSTGVLDDSGGSGSTTVRLDVGELPDGGEVGG
jgi:hypothetical protein